MIFYADARISVARFEVRAYPENNSFLECTDAHSASVLSESPTAWKLRDSSSQWLLGACIEVSTTIKLKCSYKRNAVFRSANPPMTR